MSSRRRTEAKLIEHLVCHMATLFGEDAQFALEVRSHGRARADVCVSRHGELIAIEAKLTNYRRAIGQAVLNRYFADRSYVAVRAEVISQELVDEATRWGLGVVGIGVGSTAIAHAAPLGEPDQALKHRIMRAAFP